MSDGKVSKIKQPHELKEVALIRGLIYGPPGIGKTTLALSSLRPLCIACDDGVHRIAPQHQTPTIEVERWEDCTAVLTEDLTDFNTLVIDTAGKMVLYMNDYVGRINSRNKQSDGTLTQKGYGVRRQLFLEFLSKISDLNKHIFFVSHHKEDRKGEIVYVRPDVGGSSGEDLVRELDLVGYIEPIGSVRTISFDPTEGHYGKNTIGLPPMIELPGIDKPNTFLTTILEKFAKNVKQRHDMGVQYQEIISRFKKRISDIKTHEDANAVIKYFNDYTDHIWDSLYQGKSLTFAKAREFGFIANPTTKQFEPAPTSRNQQAKPENQDGKGEVKPIKKEVGSKLPNAKLAGSDKTGKDPLSDEERAKQNAGIV